MNVYRTYHWQGYFIVTAVVAVLTLGIAVGCCDSKKVARKTNRQNEGETRTASPRIYFNPAYVVSVLPAQGGNYWSRYQNRMIQMAPGNSIAVSQGLRNGNLTPFDQCSTIILKSPESKDLISLTLPISVDQVEAQVKASQSSPP